MCRSIADSGASTIGLAPQSGRQIWPTFREHIACNERP